MAKKNEETLKKKMKAKTMTKKKNERVRKKRKI